MANWVADLAPDLAGLPDLTPDSGLDPAADPDQDGLSNQEEARWGTDPWVADSDQDGVGDGTALLRGGCPAGPAGPRRSRRHSPRGAVRSAGRLGRTGPAVPAGARFDPAIPQTRGQIAEAGILAEPFPPPDPMPENGLHYDIEEVQALLRIGIERCTGPARPSWTVSRKRQADHRNQTETRGILADGLVVARGLRYRWYHAPRSRMTQSQTVIILESHRWPHNEYEGEVTFLWSGARLCARVVQNERDWTDCVTGASLEATLTMLVLRPPEPAAPAEQPPGLRALGEACWRATGPVLEVSEDGRLLLDVGFPLVVDPEVAPPAHPPAIGDVLNAEGTLELDLDPDPAD